MESGGVAHDELIAVCAMAVRAACRRMTPPYLKALGVLLREVPGHLHHLMVTAGPACGEAVLSSRRRLLTLMRAADAEGAAGEMEQHLRSLARMRGPVPGSLAGIAV